MPDLIARRTARSKSPEATTSIAEWAWVTIFLVTLSLGIGWQSGLNHIELTFYDALLGLQGHNPDPDIVLIGVDDASVAELGPWPFSDTTETKLIDVLTAAKSRAVGFLGPLGTRPDDTGVANAEARVLAAAITANGHIALNTEPSLDAAVTPGVRLAPPIQSGAAATGSNANVGDDDGVIRRAALSSNKGLQVGSAQHFVTAVIEASGMRRELPGLRAAAVDGGPTGVGDHWVLIPYSGPPGHYPVVSYASVLDGRVPASAFAGKFVLVGPTAQSLVRNEKVPGALGEAMSARYMTPLEVDANLLAGVLQDRTITALPPLRNALACGLPIVLAMLVLIGAPRRAVWLIILLALATILASLVGIASLGIWFAPGGALVGLALALPLWRWRLLEGDAIRGDLILKRLEDGVDHYAEVGLPVVNPNAARVQRRLQTLRRTIARVETLRNFIDHVVEAIPHATLITDAEGHVMAENSQARTYFSSLGNTQIHGAQLPYLLGSLTLEGAADGRSWWDVLDKSLSATRARARDARGRDLLIRVVPWTNSNGDLSGWVATIDDVSAIRTSERRRDEALNFMSTSLSASQHNILEALGTLDVSRLGPAEAALTESIEASSTEALALTEKFIELSKAESRDYDFVACDISDAIELAIDAVYTTAEMHQATISYRRPDQPVVASIDTSMVSRAVSILLANAVRFAASGENVDVRVVEEGETVLLSITDHGRGISPAEQVRMLRALQDIQVPGAARGMTGYQMGLGLSLVRTVAEKHHGKLEFTSNPGKGSEFRIILPSWSAPFQPQRLEDSPNEAAL